MPEGYTHVHVARAAAAEAGWEITCREAFMAGANGPDMLFCFEVWKSGEKRRMNLPKLGNRMHEERTGAFLQALHRYAVTPAQRDFFMGFLAHYLTDCTLHPYVIAMCQKGMPYGRKGGHGYFEIALDSSLYARAHEGNGAVSVQEVCPRLPGKEMAEVAQQLRRAVRDVFDLELPAEYVADAFYHSYVLRGLFQSRFKIKYVLFWLIEPLFGKRGFITGHVSPRKLYGESWLDRRRKRSLPTEWTDPVTGEARREGVQQLLELAQKRIVYAYEDLRRQGGLQPGPAQQLPEAEGLSAFWWSVGSKDYVTGTETERSRQGAAQH